MKEKLKTSWPYLIKKYFAKKVESKLCRGEYFSYTLKLYLFGKKFLPRPKLRTNHRLFKTLNIVCNMKMALPFPGVFELTYLQMGGGATAFPLLLKFYQNCFKIGVFP